jgi:hypothetical protein
MATKFVRVVPNIFGPLVLNLLLYSLVSPEILRCLLDFWKMCANHRWTYHSVLNNLFLPHVLILSSRIWQYGRSPKRWVTNFVFALDMLTQHAFWCSVGKLLACLGSASVPEEWGCYEPRYERWQNFGGSIKTSLSSLDNAACKDTNEYPMPSRVSNTGP